MFCILSVSSKPYVNNDMWRQSLWLSQQRSKKNELKTKAWPNAFLQSQILGFGRSITDVHSRCFDTVSCFLARIQKCWNQGTIRIDGKENCWWAFVFQSNSESSHLQVSKLKNFEYGLPGFRPPLRRSKIHWCSELKYLDPPRETVALASFPGSGNTWLRYLLQQGTGMVLIYIFWC